MKKHCTRRIRPAGTGLLMPHQVAALLIPIQLPLELLPMGLFRETHAHSLAAFLNAIQFAANAAARDDIHAAACRAGEVLIQMRDRVRAGHAWNTSAAERETLMREITLCDQFMRRQSNTRIRRALLDVDRACARMLAAGNKVMDVVEVAP